MAEEGTNPNSNPEEATRSYRRVGILGAILFLVSFLYLLISPAISAGSTLLGLAMQLGFVGSYLLLLIGVVGVAHSGPASVFVALISNGYALASTLPLFWIPKDAEIRPMGLAGFLCLISLVCFITVAALSIQGVRINRACGWACLALPLGMCPFFVGSGVLRFAAWLKGFTLAP